MIFLLSYIDSYRFEDGVLLPGDDILFSKSGTLWFNTIGASASDYFFGLTPEESFAYMDNAPFQVAPEVNFVSLKERWTSFLSGENSGRFVDSLTQMAFVRFELGGADGTAESGRHPITIYAIDPINAEMTVIADISNWIGISEDEWDESDGDGLDVNGGPDILWGEKAPTGFGAALTMTSPRARAGRISSMAAMAGTGCLAGPATIRLTARAMPTG
nr:hypothetical protein [Pseudooceanicola lipolyticus]